MPKKVCPIKPDEVTMEKEKAFPDAVLDSFNELITQNWNGCSAVIRLADVVALMVKKGLRKKEIFGKGWLDVENAYESVGWSVKYDRPAYDESYPATFTFKHKQKN